MEVRNSDAGVYGIILDVENDGVRVWNIAINVRNSSVGIRDIATNVRSGSMASRWKFCLGGEVSSGQNRSVTERTLKT